MINPAQVMVQKSVSTFNDGVKAGKELEQQRIINLIKVYAEDTLSQHKFWLYNEIIKTIKEGN